jgi:hypothetical protein
MNACIAMALDTPMCMQYLEKCPNVSFCVKDLATIDNGIIPTWL